MHQSGKARLVIGGVSLVVHPGLPVSFVEQGVSIDSSERTFCSFGQVREEKSQIGRGTNRRTAAVAGFIFFFAKCSVSMLLGTK